MGNLYHYTSVSGFEGIITNHSIRMTKSDFLNDPTDCHFFVDLIKKYIEKKRVNISNIVKSNEDLVQTLYDKFNLGEYIEYIHKHISLYVLLLTKINDGMNMWNYYGQSGMELEISVDKLINELRNMLCSKNEFLTGAEVIYTDSESDLTNINIPQLLTFPLINKCSNNIFKDHYEKLEEQSSDAWLYELSNLEAFIDTYMKSYILSIEHLLGREVININMESDEVFEKVFNNDCSVPKKLLWKSDLTLYMIVLSAMIKSHTYDFEKEYRIVYFEYSLSPRKKKKEEYTIKHITSGDFICPYITFKDANLFLNSLKAVTIFPIAKKFPIGKDTYLETLNRYLSSHQLLEKKVQYSKHITRW